MKYILKNIRSFARDYTKIFVLLIITIAASTLIIHLSYGMFREYRDRRELSRSAANEIVFRLKSSYAQKDIARADNQMQTVGDLEGEYRFETDFLIDHGSLVNSSEYGPDSFYNYEFGNGTQNIFQYGRYFTDQEYASGEKVCIMYGFQKNMKGDYLKKYLTDDGKVLIGDREYEIIGLQDGIGTGFIPITSVGEDDVLLDEIDMRFKDNISLREINLLIQAARQCFGDRVDCNYELQQTEENDYLYNTILMLVLIVSLVAAFNFCALYHYIVTTRQRTLTIFRVCGLDYRRSVGMYLGECSILSVGTYLITLFVFRFLLMPFLAARWNVFDFHFQTKVYLILFLIYFVSSFILQFVMIRWNLKKKMIR